MSGSVGDLITRFSSTGYNTVAGQIDNLASKGTKAEKATASLTAKLGAAAAGFLSLGAAIKAVNALVETNRQFEKLRAGLVTATGSVEGMEQAWAALMQYAMDTPYGIEQVTASFTKLINYGLTPSEEAMTSYGDTASAMSKSLDQMIEAVADAATGEFERLKEFGIKAKNNGDTITFTFRGVATTVKNSSKEIEQYLIDLGKTNFGGAMQRQMNTLDGSIANLSDTWEIFKYNLSDGMFADMASSAIGLVTDGIAELNNQMESGAMESNLDAWGMAWSGWGNDLDYLWGEIESAFSDMFGNMDTTAADTIDSISNYISHFPSELRSYLQTAIAYIKSWASEAMAYGAAVAGALNPFADNREVQATLDNRIKTIRQGLQDEKDAIDSELIYTQVMQDIFGKRALDQAESNRKKNEQNEKNHQDRLAKFKVGGDSGSNSTGDDKAAKKAAKEAERLAKQREAEFERVKQSMESETETARREYEERNRIIKENTTAGSKVQEDLLAKSKTMRDKELADAKTSALAKVEQIRQDLLSEEDALIEGYERRRKLILDNTELTENQRQDLLKSLQQRHMEEQNALMLNQIATMSGYMQSSLSTMTQALADAGAESNIVYKAMFAAQKAMAIPSMIVSTEEGATKALALGPVAGPIASTAIRALGYASIATVAGQAIAGLFDQGGLIPAGKSGIVGEFGPERHQSVGVRLHSYGGRTGNRGSL
nr:hypothetical protein K21LAMBDA1_LOCUS20 [Klebsiella phage vB_Kpn_K21lambda1]